MCVHVLSFHIREYFRVIMDLDLIVIHLFIAALQLL